MLIKFWDIDQRLIKGIDRKLTVDAFGTWAIYYIH